MTKPETTATVELTAEQVKVANKLAQVVVDTEAQGSLATFQQARALQQIRDEGLYKAIQKPDGGTYTTFGDYVRGVTTKSDATISQNISVVAAFSGYADEQLVGAGPEKLYVAWKMKGEGIYTTLDEALEAARTKTRSELMEIRKSGKAPKLNLVYLSALRVTQSQADRFDAVMREKFRATYEQVYQDAGAASDAQIVDHFLNVVGGLPNDFLLMAAAGEGGAAPAAAAIANDLTDEDLAYYFADALLERGTNPEEVFERIQAGIQGRKDKYEVMKREAEEKAAAQEKAAKEAEKVLARDIKRLQNVADNTIIDFSDGAEAQVLATEADGGNGVNRIMLKGLRDGKENIYSETGEWYDIRTIAGHGPVNYRKPVKEKPAAEKKAKASKQDAGSETSLGFSKAQQTGRKPKVSKKAAPAEGDTADSGEEFPE